MTLCDFNKPASKFCRFLGANPGCCAGPAAPVRHVRRNGAGPHSGSGYGLPVIQTTLLFAGIGTLLFHVCTKGKVPAFLGSSFAFLGGFTPWPSWMPAVRHHDRRGEAALRLGGVVVAGLLYLVLALLFKLVGAKKVMRFFPPIVTGPIIIPSA